MKDAEETLDSYRRHFLSEAFSKSQPALRYELFRLACLHHAKLASYQPAAAPTGAGETAARRDRRSTAFAAAGSARRRLRGQCGHGRCCMRALRSAHGRPTAGGRGQRWPAPALCAGAGGGGGGGGSAVGGGCGGGGAGGG
jgi:hypothetical protein